MSKQDQSGPAFPCCLENRGEQPITGLDGCELPPRSLVQYGGMTLRDYFAAKAMQGFVAAEDEGDPVAIAAAAYVFADAMLEARNA